MTRVERARAVLIEAEARGLTVGIRGDWVTFKPFPPAALAAEASDLADEIGDLLEARDAGNEPPKGRVS